MKNTENGYDIGPLTKDILLLDLFRSYQTFQVIKYFIITHNYFGKKPQTSLPSEDTRQTDNTQTAKLHV